MIVRFNSNFKNYVDPLQAMSRSYKMSQAATDNNDSSQLWLIEGDDAAFAADYTGQFTEVNEAGLDFDTLSVHIYPELFAQRTGSVTFTELKEEGDEVASTNARPEAERQVELTSEEKEEKGEGKK